MAGARDIALDFALHGLPVTDENGSVDSACDFVNGQCCKDRQVAQEEQRLITVVRLLVDRSDDGFVVG